MTTGLRTCRFFGLSCGHSLLVQIAEDSEVARRRRAKSLVEIAPVA